MTTADEHTKIVKEFLDDINEKVRADLLFDRQNYVMVKIRMPKLLTLL